MSSGTWVGLTTPLRSLIPRPLVLGLFSVTIVLPFLSCIIAYNQCYLVIFKLVKSKPIPVLVEAALHSVNIGGSAHLSNNASRVKDRLQIPGFQIRLRRLGVSNNHTLFYSGE